MTAPRLLFATIAAGGGHVATARAMAEAVEACAPGVHRVEVSDYVLALGLVEQDRRHKALWRWLLRNPQLIRAGQRVLDAWPAATLAYHRKMLDDVARRAADDLGPDPPALVVVNHAFLMVALTRAQRHYGLRTPVLTFATEPFDASALWAERRAERFVVPSTAAKGHLVGMGVPAGAVDVVGYPVREAFLRPPDRDAARTELGLGGAFTALVSLGGEGIGGVPDAVVRAVLNAGAHALVVTGRNQPLRARLERWARQDGRLRVHGFVEDMPRYVAAADVVVGKAGPASTLEAVAAGRPVLVTSYAGLNERRVIEFLEHHRLGAYLPEPDRLCRAVAAYRSHPLRLEQVRQRAGALGFPEMAVDLAEYLLHYARHRRPPAGWRSRGLPAAPVAAPAPVLAHP